MSENGFSARYMARCLYARPDVDALDRAENARLMDCAAALEAENATLRGLIEERVKEWDWFTQPGSAGEGCTDPIVERMRAAISPKQTEIGEHGGA